MTRTSTTQRGFSVVELLIVVCVLGLLGFVGYAAMNRTGTTKDTGASLQTTQVSVNDVPEVKVTSDLDEAEKLLDQTSTDTDVTVVDADAASF